MGGPLTFETWAEADEWLADRRKCVDVGWEPVPSGPVTRAVSDPYLYHVAMILEEDARDLVLPDGDPDVYVIRCECYIKIGTSRRHPELRIQELKSKVHSGGWRPTERPEGMDVSRAELPGIYFSGGRETEKKLHWLARNYWVKGEWYWAESLLLAKLQALCLPAPEAHLARLKEARRADVVEHSRKVRARRRAIRERPDDTEASDAIVIPEQGRAR